MATDSTEPSARRRSITAQLEIERVALAESLEATESFQAQHRAALARCVDGLYRQLRIISEQD